MRTESTFRQRLGCWLNERWRTEFVLQTPLLAQACGLTWKDLCNRNENLTVDPSFDRARICAWADSTQLTVTRTYPDVGQRLLRHCLADWPVRLAFGPKQALNSPPQISVMIAIGGSGRIEQFRVALASIRGQTHPAFETIVVEQNPEPVLAGSLPEDVRYVFTPVSDHTPFNKSWSLNVAASMARGQQLLIHDADLVVPQEYLQQVSTALEVASGVRPARFLFYLDEESTTSILRSPQKQLIGQGVEAVVQNTPMPLGIRRDVYWDLGGHDESFHGWGGEDTEFVSRLRTRELIEGGWMPVVHLWHPPAPKKANGDRNASVFSDLMTMPAEERIHRLRRMALARSTPQPAFELATSSAAPDTLI